MPSGVYTYIRCTLQRKTRGQQGTRFGYKLTTAVGFQARSSVFASLPYVRGFSLHAGYTVLYPLYTLQLKCLPNLEAFGLITSFTSLVTKVQTTGHTNETKPW